MCNKRLEKTQPARVWKEKKPVQFPMRTKSSAYFSLQES